MPVAELVDEPGVDRPERRALGVDAVVDQPLDLRAGEVGVEHEPRALAKQLLPALVLQLGASVGRAPVLPHDRGSERLAAASIPGDDGLALVRDADRGEVGCADARIVDRLLGDGQRHVPDLVRVVLDPARPREVLLELAVGAAGDLAVAGEDHAVGAGGALVDCEDHARREA